MTASNPGAVESMDQFTFLESDAELFLEDLRWNGSAQVVTEHSDGIEEDVGNERDQQQKRSEAASVSAAEPVFAKDEPAVVAPESAKKGPPLSSLLPVAALVDDMTDDTHKVVHAEPALQGEDATTETGRRSSREESVRLEAVAHFMRNKVLSQDGRDAKLVNGVTRYLLADAQKKAAASKLALRQSLKADLARRKESMTYGERSVMRSRREAAVSRENKLAYVRQLESLAGCLVQGSLSILIEGRAKAEAGLAVQACGEATNNSGVPGSLSDLPSASERVGSSATRTEPQSASEENMSS